MKIVTNQFRYYPKLLFGVLPLLVLVACDNPALQPPPSPIRYHFPVDSAYKALENLNYAYVSRDIGHYLNCFKNDFEFNYLLNGDTLTWGLDTEQEIHQSIFNQVCLSDLTLSGYEEYPWSGDTTGSTLLLPREYDLKVYMVPDSVEYRAQGTAEFICRQDSMGEWYVWQWWDFPDPGKDGWGDIKLLFFK